MRGATFSMPERAAGFDRMGVPELVEPRTDTERKEKGLEGAADRGRELAEALKGERWHAMAPPWSGQFVLSGDEDPHVGRFVCCTDATLHMDEADLEAYRDDDPAERADFIAHHDPATVLAMYEEMSRLRDKSGRQRATLDHLADELREIHGNSRDYRVRAFVGQLIGVAEDPSQLLTLEEATERGPTPEERERLSEDRGPGTADSGAGRVPEALVEKAQAAVRSALAYARFQAHGSFERFAKFYGESLGAELGDRARRARGDGRG